MGLDIRFFLTMRSGSNDCVSECLKFVGVMLKEISVG
jgi:hypothetical protein